MHCNTVFNKNLPVSVHLLFLNPLKCSGTSYIPLNGNIVNVLPTLMLKLRNKARFRLKWVDCDLSFCIKVNCCSVLYYFLTLWKALVRYIYHLPAVFLMFFLNLILKLRNKAGFRLKWGTLQFWLNKCIAASFYIKDHLPAALLKVLPTLIINLRKKTTFRLKRVILYFWLDKWIVTLVFTCKVFAVVRSSTS